MSFFNAIVKPALRKESLFVAIVLFATSAFSAESDEPKKGAGDITPAEFIERADGKYPESLRRFGVQGDGLVYCTLTQEGKATDIKVVRSPHPAFEYAMVQILLASKFKPAMQNGVPIQRRVGFPMRLRTTGSNNEKLGARDQPFAFPEKRGADLADAMSYDVAPVIKVVAPVVYPRHLLDDRTVGRAEVLVTLDAKGTVRIVKVVAATHPEFGEATRAMMFAWEFSPAMKDGKAIPATFAYEQEFDVRGRDTWSTQVIKRLQYLISEKSPEIVEFETLDKRPAARYQPLPVDPRAGDALPEDVAIEFFIDPDGGVQLPVIKTAKTAELGWAAATAVKRWIFEPPTANGKPVFARRELQFSFR